MMTVCQPASQFERMKLYFYLWHLHDDIKTQKVLIVILMNDFCRAIVAESTVGDENNRI